MIAVLWPYPRHTLVIDFPELRGRKDIIFINSKESLTQLYGRRNIQYIWPSSAYKVSSIVRDEFKELIRHGNFIEYKSEETNHEQG